MSRIIIGVAGSKTWENKAKIKTFLFKLRDKTADEIVIVGMGDKQGADSYVKKYALELGYVYQEMNPPHTPKNLYSMMSEAYHNRPYQDKNFFQRNLIYCQYIHKCVIFDDTNLQDKKLINLVKQLTKAKKIAVIITT